MQRLEGTSPALNVKLPDFITMTNFCEKHGYSFEFIRSKKGVTCDLYKDNELKKIGQEIFKTCIDAQQHCYTLLYKNLKRIK